MRPGQDTTPYSESKYRTSYLARKRWQTHQCNPARLYVVKDDRSSTGVKAIRNENRPHWGSMWATIACIWVVGATGTWYFSSYRPHMQDYAMKALEQEIMKDQPCIATGNGPSVVCVNYGPADDPPAKGEGRITVQEDAPVGSKVRGPSVMSGALYAMPEKCTVGDIYYAAGVPAGHSMYVCMKQGTYKTVNPEVHK